MFSPTENWHKEKQPCGDQVPGETIDFYFPLSMCLWLPQCLCVFPSNIWAIQVWDQKSCSNLRHINQSFILIITHIYNTLNSPSWHNMCLALKAIIRIDHLAHCEIPNAKRNPCQRKWAWNKVDAFDVQFWWATLDHIKWIMCWTCKIWINGHAGTFDVMCIETCSTLFHNVFLPGQRPLSI